MVLAADVWARANNIEDYEFNFLAATLRLPSGTTTNIGDEAHAINTLNKDAGTLIYNSTTGAILVSEGPGINDIWNTAAGVTSITPA